MLTVSNLSVRLPDRVLLNSVNFTVNRNECVGIVGPNGAGKSTLLSAIAGLRTPDEGSISVAPGATLGFLRQGVADRPDGTLGDLLDDHLDGVLAAHRRLEESIEHLNDLVSDSAIEAFEHATELFERAGGYARLALLEESMHAFGVGEFGFDRPLSTLSGGEKTRAALSALIATEPDLLLLDEPSNHLDRAGIAWLEAFLRKRTGATIVVSHDRALLDAIATKLAVIDEDDGTVREFVGGYTAFAETRQHEAEEREAAWHRQQELIGRVEGDIRRVAGKASSYEALSVNDYQRGRSRKIARTAVVRRRKLERLLDSDERIDRPERKWGMAVSFGEAPTSGNRLVHIESGSIDVGGTPLLAGIDLTIGVGDRIGLIGSNGAGKTTLLAAIAGRVPFADGVIYRTPGLKIGWFTQEHEGVELNRTPLDQARARSVGTEGDVRAFLHQFLLGPQQVLRPSGELSYGERARLALALLAIGGANLLLLDEPMNHLDIPSREQLEEAIAGTPVAVVLVSHDRYALERLDVELKDVEHWRVKQI
jgi:ATP-binding cassette subfamily F protein 3